MKYFKRYLLLSFASFMMLFSCETFDLEDGLVSPNNPPAEEANPDLLLNSIQLGFGSFFFNASEIGMELTRMKAMFGNQYEVDFGPNYFRSENSWFVYEGLLNDVQVLKSIAETSEQDLNYHLGMAKVIEAYTLMTLVDNYGDVPYSEAFQGVANLNPAVDSGAEVYSVASDLLVEAVDHFNQVGSFGGTDLFYAGSESNWIKVANTLRLKIAIQTRLVNPDAQSQIQQLLNSDLISSAADNWVWRYGTNTANPDTRHPYFTANYGVSASDYMSNDLMNDMLNGVGGIMDPRMRYYFYRQVSQVSTDFNELPCINDTKPAHYLPEDPFCALADGYWGRDHLDNDGIPPDGFLRTVFGVYPSGGKYDDNDFAATETTDGLEGAGILPIMLSSYVDFLRAEAAVVYGIGDASSALQSAVSSNIDYIRSFSASETADANNVPAAGDVTTFVNAVVDEFNAQGSNEDRLNVIMNQFRIAAFGNGIEIYNAYRRTGLPRDLQPGLLADFGTFPRSLWYTATEVDLNSSIDQKSSVAEQVFWDNNSAGFID